jgi:cyclopropane-fatty-acyl-phospholipid synthase
MAERYPNSRIVGVSNSHSQRDSILERAAAKGLSNLEIITCDMNAFDTDRRFDRIVSVEMFEHMRNWSQLFGRVAGWLQPDGRFFMHVFCHKSLPYTFEVQDESDWMSRFFFSGGMMPSYDLATLVESPLHLVKRWQWSGQHYEKTANAWLANMDRHKAELWPILAETYGKDQAQTWWVRWRIFFMACAELFGYRNGSEWPVGHYLFRRGA